MFRDLVDEDLDDYFPEPDKFLDVPFVPSDANVIKAMLQLAKVGPRDIVYDLGSGEGCILIAAAKHYGARGIGIEIDPLRIADAMEFAGWAHVEHRVDFIEDDIFSADISDATVVTLYLLESINIQLRPRLLSELHPGTRVISHAFHMGDWQPDERLELSGISVYKWIVPARVDGLWEWEGYDGTPYRAELQQKYQEISANVWVNDKTAGVKSAELCGNRLELHIQESDATEPESFLLFFENHELHSVEHN